MFRIFYTCFLTAILSTGCVPTGEPDPKPVASATNPDPANELESPGHTPNGVDDIAEPAEPTLSDVPAPATSAVRMELRPIPTGPLMSDALFSEATIAVTNPGLAVARPILFDVEENEVPIGWDEIARLETEIVGSSTTALSATTIEGDLVWTVRGSRAEVEYLQVRVVGEFENKTLEAEITLVVHPEPAVASLVFAPIHARIGPFAWYRHAQILPGVGVAATPDSSRVLAGGVLRTSVVPFLRLAGAEVDTYVPPELLQEMVSDNDAVGQVEWDAGRLTGTRAGVVDVEATFDVGGESITVSDVVEVLDPWVAHDLMIVDESYHWRSATRLQPGECVLRRPSIAIGDATSAIFPSAIDWAFVDVTLDTGVAELDEQRGEVCAVAGGETWMQVSTNLLGTSPAIEATHRVGVVGPPFAQLRADPSELTLGDDLCATFDLFARSSGDEHSLQHNPFVSLRADNGGGQIQCMPDAHGVFTCCDFSGGGDAVVGAIAVVEYLGAQLEIPIAQ